MVTVYIFLTVVGRLYQADRKIYSRIRKPDLQVTFCHSERERRISCLMRSFGFHPQHGKSHQCSICCRANYEFTSERAKSMEVRLISPPASSASALILFSPVRT